MEPNLSLYLTNLRDNFESLSQEYGVKSLHIFGSVARGTSTDKSDIDILVSFYETPSLFILVSLETRLSRLLSRPVDLVLDTEIASYARKRIYKEMVKI